MVDDPRINAEEKEAFLERIYGMKPVPAKKPVDRKEARAVGDAAPRIGPDSRRCVADCSRLLAINRLLRGYRFHAVDSFEKCFLLFGIDSWVIDHQ